MHILVLDPGISTGYIVCKIESNICNIVEYGFLTVIKDTDYVGDWCLNLISQLSVLHSKYNFTTIALEDFFFSSRFANGGNVNVNLRTAIYIFARSNFLPYEILNISLWKKFIADRILPTKEEKKKYGKVKAKKQMIVDALKNKWNIEFPEFSISNKTGKKIKFKNDISDAMGQAIYFSYNFCDCNKVVFHKE